MFTEHTSKYYLPKYQIDTDRTRFVSDKILNLEFLNYK